MVPGATRTLAAARRAALAGGKAEGVGKGPEGESDMARGERYCDKCHKMIPRSGIYQSGYEVVKYKPTKSGYLLFVYLCNKCAEEEYESIADERTVPSWIKEDSG